MKNHNTKIKERALELGFDACGISRALFLHEEESRLSSWLKNGYHADLLYMENNFEKRLDPTKLVENSKSVISVLLNYFPTEVQKDPEAPIISKYAYGQDYHDVIKNKLFSLFNYINEEIQPIQGRAFVDSAPVLDKAWAQRGGLGWVGKNGMLINKKLGSFFFIGELIIDLELEPDAEFIGDFCGNCTKCIDSCPTQALVSPKTIDARKCISYLTIENKGEIDSDFKEKLQNRVYGCDICQDVCPWNQKNAKPHKTAEFNPKPEILEMTKDDWQNLSEEKYKSLFKKSAVKRAKYNGLKRNIDFLED